MKTAMKKITLGLSVAALAVGGIAYAQQTPPAKPFMDADKDGVITRAEAQKAAEDMFVKLDVNKDGKIDQADRDARHAEHRAEMFAMIDANKDGSISRQEFMDAKPPHGPGDRGPGAPDGNGPPPPPPGMDGDSMGGPGMGGPGMGGPGMGGPGMDGHHRGGPGRDGHGMHGRGGMRGHGMMMLKMADTNNDGAVSKAEFMAAATKHFGDMDANNDGKVTKEERQAARQKMKAQWQADKPAKK
ncbi:EF-hand domain-containing protein [Novosphingobium album (ex Hu et al. 2023)]|uniref:EF-hand domain-containing protein n=1 Tax=Novosphingobium album (ex Hu et al. 2023) TaxID=2930093 RepID=A0ABT0B0R7_9SPHN|nr:EF-hand domain-containing protein [Novosphingobium album (ex Hu et al. 2023)]MCJ2178639.1 EF-hand domain-containing protein [Novosphingobium album (ex Hu et al. 2023)]